MAKDYLQRYRIDFKKIYTTFAKIVILYIFIALAAYFGWFIK